MSLWNHYLDAADAAVVLHAAEVVESHRAVREPLPFDDAERLLQRLRRIAELYRVDAGHWRNEAEDRREEAAVDGGRWGSREVATRMAAIAERTATDSETIAAAADAAARDLAGRLRDTPGAPTAERAAAEQARRLLDELGLRGDDPQR